MTATLTCLQCGSDLAFGDRFCATCGVEALPGETPPAAATRPDSPSALADILERLRRVTLGEFEIGRELGRGGMAAVFLAHEIALDRKVAIKVMSPGLLLDDGMVERFKREAITVAQLNHPGIVSAYSVRHADGLYFFIMRYVEGRSLEQVLQQAGRLPLPTVRSILHQVGSALTYAHRSGVVHRDIKPANILIDQDGNAVVSDFGIAKVAERPTQTLTGALVGTPAYMSPEQCKGGTVSGASDQYSLGAVAYELVTGVPPFSGSTLTVMQSHVERQPCPIRELSADCPPEIEAAIHRMLEKEPGDRWPRLADALTALRAEVLADDHPLRTELSRYAGAGAPASGQLTPTSPAPRTRASAVTGTPSRPVGDITIMPAPAGLEVGDSFRLVAVLWGHNGTRLPSHAVQWASDAPTVLRVDAAAGEATAVGPGAATVTATCRGVTGRLRVDVTTPRADDIVIEPMDEPLEAGEEIRLDATARDKRGRPVYRPVSWLSADANIAVVTPHGMIAGRAPGTVRITAALDDARASIVIPVLPPRVAAVDIVDLPASVTVGETVVLNARPLDGSNTPLPGRQILWSTSDAGVAAVTDEGWLAALQPGSVMLTATCEGVRAMVRLGVVAGQAPRAEPMVRPVVRRRPRRARRRGVLAAVAVLAGVGLWLWRRSTTQTVPEGAAPASYVAGAAGVDTSAPAIDTSPPALDTSAPASVVITQRPTRSLRPDGVTTLAAEVRDPAGRPRPAAPIAWTTTDSTIAAVDRATGRVRGIRPGRVLVTAASGGGRDSIEIAVRRPGVAAPVVASVRIADLPTLRVGDTAVLHAVATGPAGDTLVGADVSWASTRPGVAPVDPLTGVARAVSPGSAVILARSGRETGFAELTVLPAPVAAIQILGARPMAVRETLSLRIAAEEGEGGDLSGMPATWTSSDSAVATVDEATGAVVGREPGSSRITATADGATAWIRITVLPRPERLPVFNDAEPADARLLAGVEECFGAVQARDLIRLRSMWHPTPGADEERLRRLGRILRELGATVGERLDHAPIIGLESAALEFAVPLAWREGSGSHAAQPVFRAEFVRNAGRWEMSSCRIAGTPRL